MAEGFKTLQLDSPGLGPEEVDAIIEEAMQAAAHGMDRSMREVWLSNPHPRRRRRGGEKARKWRAAHQAKIGPAQDRTPHPRRPEPLVRAGPPPPVWELGACPCPWNHPPPLLPWAGLPVLPAFRECWNCGGGHRYNKCPAPPRVFCLRCGLRNVTLWTCPRDNVKWRGQGAYVKRLQRNVPWHVPL